MRRRICLRTRLVCIRFLLLLSTGVPSFGSSDMHFRSFYSSALRKVTSDELLVYLSMASNQNNRSWVKKRLATSQKPSTLMNNLHNRYKHGRFTNECKLTKNLCIYLQVLGRLVRQYFLQSIQEPRLAGCSITFYNYTFKLIFIDR